MVQSAVGGELVERDRRARLGIAASEGKRRDARLDHRPHAHGARLERDVDLGADQPVGTEPPRGAAQRQEFGMSGRIVRADRLVAGPRQHLAAGDDHGADRHFAAALRALCLG